MKLKSLNRMFIFVILTGGLLAGCARTPSPIYYTLSPIEGMARSEASVLQHRDVSIGIGPVKFPETLNSHHIVTRRGSNRLESAQSHRWGGSLKSNFVGVLVENLMGLMGTNRVVAQPWERYFKPDYRIVLIVRRFDGRLGENATLDATWMIIDKDDEKPLAVKRSQIQGTLLSKGYDALVTVQSQLTATLSKEIAEELLKQLSTLPK